MSGSSEQLLACIDADVIAYLGLKNDEIHWQYTRFWQKNGYALSPYLPLDGEINARDVKRYLNNLLPEGDGLETLTSLFRVSKSNTFALVKILGQDLPSVFSLSDHECSKNKDSSFVELDEDDLINRLNNLEPRLAIWDDKPRLSVAGVQNKMNIVVNEEGKLGFGEGMLRSTHLLKFEEKKSIHLVVNEYVTMRLAMACGLNVADVELRFFETHPALLVERFDRKLLQGVTLRRHMIDGCQALNLPPEYKYERNFGKGRDVKHIRDGASLTKLFDFTNQCRNPALAKQTLLDWVVFNLLVLNADAHGKNISFFVSNKGIELCPFYDLVNIGMFKEFDQDLAMAIGDEFDINGINAYQLADFADNCMLTRSVVVRTVRRLAKKVILNVDEIINMTHKVTRNGVSNTFFESYQQMVVDQAEHLLAESELILSIEL